MKPTKEQQEAINYVSNNEKDLIINAFAGTGKTSTLVQIVEANPDTRFLYLAFNRAVKKEAESKFGNNCKVYTLHGMAYALFARDHYGRDLRTRLSLRWKNRDYADFFEVKGTPVNTRNFIMYASRRMLTNFKNSGSFKISTEHVDPEHVLKLQNKDMDKVLELANKLWKLEQDPNSEVPIDHDTYLKGFQLSRPQINICDVVLLDEAQDTNPVAESIIQDLNTRVVLVGDQFQAIYEWRGAVNSMERLKKECKTLWLTKSFRFGDEIAGLATKILKMLDPKTPTLVGNSDIDSKINSIPKGESQTTLFRTNAEVARRALELISAGYTVYVEGGVAELCNDLTDVYALSKGFEKSNKSNKYRIFKNFQEVEEEAEHSVDIEFDLKFLSELGSKLPEAISTLRRSVKDRRSIRRVDYILSTAHKAKGLEWDNVKLHDDFRFVSLSKSEWNLIYVAITRARKNLEVPVDLKAGMEYYIKKTQGFEETEQGRGMNTALGKPYGEASAISLGKGEVVYDELGKMIFCDDGQGNQWHEWDED